MQPLCEPRLCHVPVCLPGASQQASKWQVGAMLKVDLRTKPFQYGEVCSFLTFMGRNQSFFSWSKHSCLSSTRHKAICHFLCGHPQNNGHNRLTLRPAWSSASIRTWRASFVRSVLVHLCGFDEWANEEGLALTKDDVLIKVLILELRLQRPQRLLYQKWPRLV